MRVNKVVIELVAKEHVDEEDIHIIGEDEALRIQTESLRVMLENYNVYEDFDVVIVNTIEEEEK